MKKKFLMARAAAMLFTALFCFFGANSLAQTRIAVVSDIHVMSPDLFEPGAESLEAWTTYYASQRKMLEQSADLFDQFVDKMLSSEPNVLLVTGDLTKDGEVFSHDYVCNGLKKLKEAGIKVLVIPGNHDIGGNGNNAFFYADGSVGEISAFNEADFAEFYVDYGYSGSTVDPKGSLSYVAEPIEGLVVLAIDSHTASVSAETLAWLCSKATEARNAGKQVIAMMHHPLFPHITGAELFISTYTVNDYETVRDALIGAGVNVILTGHFHTSDIAKDWNGDDPVNPIYDINTGSLISYPCDYRMLTLSADKRTIQVETASLTPTGWTAEECKTWLHDRVKAIVTKQIQEKIKAKLGALATYFLKQYSEQIASLAEFAATVYILHAEGDEPQSPQKGTYSTLYSQAENYNNLATTFGYNVDFSSLTHSILDDVSNYDTYKADQTDDRLLFIPPLMKGDVNGDGELTITDAALVMDYIKSGNKPANFVLAAAEVDGKDGITTGDVVAILDIILSQ